jgi:benzoate/toluate 1,2-dioxygenase beta subunit
MKPSRRDAEDFLYHEARLLDERKFEEWLKMFTSDGVYWIPMGDNSDPVSQPSIIYDDASLRKQRVYQILQQSHYAQAPPSRTMHVVSNIEVSESKKAEALVRCNLIVFDIRPGDHQDLHFGFGKQRSFAGRCEYRLRHEEKWLIALKKVVLLNRDLPIYNLSFIL